MIDTIRALAADDLRDLADAIRAGRLAYPPGTLALRGLCGECDVTALAREIGELAREGLSAPHCALLLESIAAERGTGVGRGAEAAELVWTGPEAPGTASRDTAVVVRELFHTAASDVLVAGYAVYQGLSVFAALAERMAALPELRVRMFLDISRPRHDTSLDSEIRLRFAHRFRTEQWPGSRLPEIYYDPRALALETKKRAALHAKCVVIDRRVAFVSSANFTEAAQTRNIEVGVLIRAPQLAATLADHFEKLMACGALHRLLP